MDNFETVKTKGHWVNGVYCSLCGRFPVDVSCSISNRELTKKFSYCPHCGKEMELYHEYK